MGELGNGFARTIVSVQSEDEGHLPSARKQLLHQKVFLLPFVCKRVCKRVWRNAGSS